MMDEHGVVIDDGVNIEPLTILTERNISVELASELVDVAVLSERERCARLVEADEFDCRYHDPTIWSNTVAMKIRSGK